MGIGLDEGFSQLQRRGRVQGQEFATYLAEPFLQLKPEIPGLAVAEVDV